MPPDPQSRSIEQPLVPLRRIGPSRFAYWRACKLREAYRACVTSGMLPRTPAAHLGAVIHRVLEIAAHAELLERETAEKLFAEQVAAEERVMLASEVDCGRVPLMRSVRDFEVRRHRAIRAAINASGHARPRAATRGPVGSVGHEVWIETPDHAAGGFVDEIASVDGCVIIRDFKTGLAARRGTAEHAEALLQLKLYAAIYAEAFGLWPEAIEVVPLQGEPITLKVDPQECAGLLAEARTLLRDTNAAIESAGLNAAQVLAAPAPQTCRTCEFRPLCRSYLAVSDRSEDPWPRDVVGVLLRRIAVRNGTLLLEVEDGAGAVARVRGVTADARRHPQLDLLEIGRKIGVFNVEGSQGNLEYAEGPSTIIVVYEGESLMHG